MFVINSILYLSNGCEIFIILLSKKFNEFYNTYAYMDDSIMIEFFCSMDLSEYQSLITTAEKFEVDFFIRNIEI